VQIRDSAEGESGIDIYSFAQLKPACITGHECRIAAPKKRAVHNDARKLLSRRLGAGKIAAGWITSATAVARFIAPLLSCDATPTVWNLLHL
jgi:hypothetical protein